MKKRYAVVAGCALMAIAFTSGVVLATIHTNPVFPGQTATGQMTWNDEGTENYTSAKLCAKGYESEAHFYASRNFAGIFGSTNTSARAVIRVSTDPAGVEDVRVMGSSGAKVEMYNSGDVVITLGN